MANTTQNMPLAVATRYTRSIHLQRDFTTVQTALVGYQATPLVIQTIEHIVAALNMKEGLSRAFSLIGPYGSGKSAFALFLSHYMSVTPHERTLLITMHGTAPLADTHPIYQAPKLLPLLISGSNSSLRQAVLHALHTSLNGNVKKGVKTLLKDLHHAMKQDNVDPQAVADFVQQASHKVKTYTTFDGLMLVVDELGQHLNYAAHQHSDGDLHVLQTLAEMATRSGDVPCVIITILHQAFDRYVGTAGIRQQTEWAKIQGRFVDIPFFEPDVQLLRMIARALCPDRQEDAYAQTRQQWAETVVPLTEELCLRPAAIDEDEWVDLVARAYPLHPTVLLVLPVLFRQLAQNERSLFAFLTSYEPWSLQDYLTSVVDSDTTALPIYRLTHLYDYVEATLGPSLFARASGRRWVELAEACMQVASKGAMAQHTLKVIGTLNAIGQVDWSGTLRANGRCVSFALYDTLNAPQAQTTLDQLRTQQHIIYRAHRDSFVLWEGSDLDIVGMVQTARQQETDRRHVASLLQEHTTMMPMVARKHSYVTGTVRHFDVRFVSVADLATPLHGAAESDGDIIYVVPMDDEELDIARAWVTQPERQDEQQRIAVLPKYIQHLNAVVRDVVAMQYVLDQQPELEHDRVAKRELASQLAEAQHALGEAIDASFGIFHSEWWESGKSHTLESRRQFDNLLSQVCDTVFPLVPRIWNELIVRRYLSSAATKARRNLIAAMLDHGYVEYLGITGYPPERAIYESVLHRSGIHQQGSDGMWRFGPPSKEKSLDLHAVWLCIQEFITSTKDTTRPLTTLYDTLQAPPYGVRAGVVPILFMAAYLEQAGEIALYLHGSYVPVPDIAIFEMLLKRPELFTLRLCRVTGTRSMVYDELAKVFAPDALTKEVQPALLDVVTPLLRIVKNLPEYSRYTEHVSVQTAAIRHCLLYAQSPDDVLFTDLPKACGLAPLQDDAVSMEVVVAFLTYLKDGLKELQQAYPDLIERVADAIREAFRASAQDLDELRQELAYSYSQIATVTSDTAIRAFGVRVEKGQPGAAWVESVGLWMRRKAMHQWRDNDADECVNQIADLGKRFCRLEDSAVAIRAVPESSQLRRMSLDDLHEEKSLVLHPLPYNNAMQSLKQAVEDALEQHAHLSFDQKMTVWTEITEQFLTKVDRGYEA